ncbi:transcriptional regulator, TetR family [Kosakonia oryzendophytica]|uniref:Transcriptional regulator, TetR family n=1 Tax=Kosakonia oryzendophytica TaxID=1005665 RepID=A0A1C4CE84_9ENTR|nr:TetR/AcrR family transcriptional regulator [Kosakonia oryzendophytica]SCC17415.1 transcriptional regulator, TetR family [Kosakonia oryzendophytica]
MNVKTDIPEKRSAKEKIVQTAHELFYQYGIRATGIDKIIECAQVTKVTFYRHFPSKNALILTYLEYRHTLWMDWFNTTMARYMQAGKGNIRALLATLQSWADAPDFRGCAFLNATSEMGEALPDVVQMTRMHKLSVEQALGVHWNCADPARLAASVMAFDGAIMHMQMGRPANDVLAQLSMVLTTLFHDEEV